MGRGQSEIEGSEWLTAGQPQHYQWRGDERPECAWRTPFLRSCGPTHVDLLIGKSFYVCIKQYKWDYAYETELKFITFS